MNAWVLETERLRFRPFTPDDLPLVVDLHADPLVQRHLGGAWDAPQMQATLDRFVSQQASQGYAKWAAFLKDGTFVGRAGVGAFPALSAAGLGGDQELGYSFKAAVWGRGLATEAAIAVRDWFWANTRHDRLFGFTETENAASRRVLEKLGMRPLPDCDLGFGQPSALYRIDRPA